jgi:DNA-binding transcriptional regulator YhcF (GntR family)
MAAQVIAGVKIAQVAVNFNVHPMTVERAWREFRRELRALARQQSGTEASRNGSQQATTTVV